jgi:hypothetical protein
MKEATAELMTKLIEHEAVAGGAPDGNSWKDDLPAESSIGAILAIAAAADKGLLAGQLAKIQGGKAILKEAVFVFQRPSGIDSTSCARSSVWDCNSMCTREWRLVSVCHKLTYFACVLHVANLHVYQV